MSSGTCPKEVRWSSEFHIDQSKKIVIILVDVVRRRSVILGDV